MKKFMLIGLKIKTKNLLFHFQLKIVGMIQMKINKKLLINFRLFTILGEFMDTWVILNAEFVIA